MRGEIYIRAFLLGLENLDEIRGRVDHGSPDFARAEITLDNLKIRECAQSPPEHELPDGLAGIVGQRGDFGREKLRGDDLVARKHLLNERDRIQPTQRGGFERAVKEIETVNIKDGFQKAGSLSANPL